MSSPTSPIDMASPWAALDGRDRVSFTDPARPSTSQVKVWDGAARDSYVWDGLRKDPSLWSRNGNCLIYLYGHGQSGQGPSFKVQFRHLLANRCFPLIQRFLVTEGPAPRTLRELEIWGTDPEQTVELYIPPPATANWEQTVSHRIAMRNFFAWILRRSVVGERLGQALVGLLHNMKRFRADVKDNTADLMDYMDEEGYLELANRPTHALAALFLAETLHLRDLFIRALAHCVGMKDAMLACLEYHELSSSTKKLIRDARDHLELRVQAASLMLSNFLSEPLSESRLGIPSAAKAHLKRFREFMHCFYSSRLGCYPPRVFDPQICRSMRDDFEALYQLLVDETYSASEGMPWVASGGICTLQLVQMFDKAHGMQPLEHPLPLLPQLSEKRGPRRLSLRFRTAEAEAPRRLLAHGALVKASNWQDKTIFDNGLVNAYRAFEDDFVLEVNKTKKEKVSVVDSRKVRWLLIHAAYQTLRSVTMAPPEVFDAAEAHYHVAISTEGLPSWLETAAEPISSQPWGPSDDEAALSQRDDAPSVYWADTAGEPDGSGRIEIKPDIDYSALTHRDVSPTDTTRFGSGSQVVEVTPPKRHGSVSRALRRSSTVRRSMRLFRPMSAPSSPSVASPRKPAHNEILIQGYGNGLNDAKRESEKTEQRVAMLDTRNSSTASNKESCGSLSSPEGTESGETAESSVGTPVMETSLGYSLPWDSAPCAEGGRPEPQRRQTISMLVKPSRRGSIAARANAFRRPMSTMLSKSDSGTGRGYADGYPEQDASTDEHRYSFFGSVGGPMGHKRHSRQPQIAMDDDWAAMQSFMDGGSGQNTYAADDDEDVMPAWEQYTDLGGLTETA